MVRALSDLLRDFSFFCRTGESESPVQSLKLCYQVVQMGQLTAMSQAEDETLKEMDS